jgi:hypothetical protein
VLTTGHPTFRAASRSKRKLLAPVYNWITEGFDTRNLKEAKALLIGCMPDN